MKKSRFSEVQISDLSSSRTPFLHVTDAISFSREDYRIKARIRVGFTLRDRVTQSMMFSIGR